MVNTCCCITGHLHWLHSSSSFPSYIASGWSLLLEEVWTQNAAKRKLHQGNYRLAGTLRSWFLIFIFTKITAGKRYRLYGLKLYWQAVNVTLLYLHTLVPDTLQPPLTNLASFCAFTSQNQSQTVPNHTLWTEWIPVCKIHFYKIGIHSVTAQPHSSGKKTHKDLGSLYFMFQI